MMLNKTRLREQLEKVVATTEAKDYSKARHEALLLQGMINNYIGAADWRDQADRITNATQATPRE